MAGISCQTFGGPAPLSCLPHYSLYIPSTQPLSPPPCTLHLDVHSAPRFQCADASTAVVASGGARRVEHGGDEDGGGCRYDLDDGDWIEVNPTVGDDPAISLAHLTTSPSYHLRLPISLSSSTFFLFLFVWSVYRTHRCSERGMWKVDIFRSHFGSRFTPSKFLLVG